MNSSERNMLVAATVVILLTLVFASVSVTAVPHKVTVETEGEGSASPSEAVVRYNRSVDIVFNPAPGWELGLVTVNGVPAEVNGDTLHLKAVKEDLHVKVVFVRLPDTFILHTDVGEGGSIDLFGKTSYIKGTVAVAAVLPDEGKTLCSLKVDGVPVDLTNLLKIEMNSDHTVEAVFRDRAETDHFVSISVSVDGKTLPGTTGYTRLVPAASFYAEPGTDVVFSILPADNYSLTDMILDGRSVGVCEEYTVPDVSKNIDFGFVLNKNTYAIAITHSEHGRLSPSGTVTVARGSEFTVTILPDEGYRLSALIVDGESVGTGFERYTFSDITADHTVYAEFSEVPVPPGRPDFTAWVNKVVEYDGRHASERIVNASLSEGDPFSLTNISPGTVQIAEIELRNTGKVDLETRLCLNTLICTAENLVLADYIDIVCKIGTEEYRTTLGALVGDKEWSVDLVPLPVGGKVPMYLEISISEGAGNIVQGKSLNFTLQINAYAGVD